jgi:hypothetical protein
MSDIQCAACRYFDRWFCRDRRGSWNRAKGQDPHLFHACKNYEAYTSKSDRNIWEYQRQPNHTLDGLVSE